MMTSTATPNITSNRATMADSMDNKRDNGSVDSDFDMESELVRALDSSLSDMSDASNSSPSSDAPRDIDGDSFGSELDRLLRDSGMDDGTSPPDTPAPTTDTTESPSPIISSPSPRSHQLSGMTASSPPPLDPLDSEMTDSISSSSSGSTGGSLLRYGVSLGVLVGIIGGAIWYGYNRFESSSEIPVVLADTSPVKEQPADSGGEVVPNQNQTVYREVEGADSSPSQLENRTETPVSLGASSSSTPSIEPRIVSTLTVRPDGTIVEDGVTAPATSEPLAPVVELKEPPTATSTSTPTSTSTSPTPAPTVPSAPEPIVTVLDEAPTSSSASNPEDLIASKILEQAGSTPTPSQPTQQEVLASAPAPTSTPTPTSTSSLSSSPYAVQVSSRRTEADAISSWNKLSSRYSSILGGYTPEIRRTEITGRGIFFRVRIPSETQAEARDLCSQLKSAGGDCFVVR